MAHLDEKAAMVTGGSRGIGAAVVRRLANDGANVAFTYQKNSDAAAEVTNAVRAANRRALAIQADSGNPEAVAGAVDRAAAELGRLDILVSSAGTLLFKPISEFTVEDFDRMVAVDLRGAFVASHTAAGHMTGDGGRIVLIGSNLADYAALPTTSLYAMVKSGLVGLANGMARDLGPQGITVNVVQPGPIDTDSNPADGPYADQFRSLMATPRYGSGDDVAAMVAFLAGDEAAFATAGGFTVDNGYSA